MKRLTLLRHAKSDWDDPVARDFDRPLNRRGEKAAMLMGQFAAQRAMRFDMLVASPAVRVVQTLETFFAGYGETLDARWDRRIYLASGATLLDVVHDQDNATDRLLMCGHNPGLEDLILMLVPDKSDDRLRDESEEKFPTASVAVITFDVSRWADVAIGGGLLERFVRPRDLDPALGPENDH